MDVKWASVILLGMIGTGWAETAQRIQVDVYVQTDNWPQLLGEAEGLASKLFERSDVRVTWHAGELPAVPDTGRTVIGIRMAERAPASLSARALAAARPYGSSGSLICVYRDRLQRLLDGLPSLSHSLLAYVLAHELAHVMLGNGDHSESGVLKAVWSEADYGAMRARRLGFTDLDVDRIRDALVVRLATR